jgi:fibronectin type 3 domain-containing protein
MLAVLPSSAEYLFMKDGPVIKGKIANETGDIITLQDDENRTTLHPRSKVMRISYSDQAIAKIYVQLKNGENFRGYIVDEDREIYTFRYILDKPDEFTVKRSDVLFTASRNPSGLKARAGYTEIDLKWYPAFDRMSYFNIYIKKKKDDKYVKIDRSPTNSIKLKNLQSNTKYYIRLTGVDDAGAETLPGKEISVTTFARVDVKLKDGKEFKTNLAAEDNDKYTFRDDINKAKEYTVRRSDVLFITDHYPSGLKGEGSFTDISLNWYYPYNKMEHFNIYLKKSTEDKYTLAGKAGSNSFKLKGLKGNMNYNIRVTGVNEAGIETAQSNEIIVTTLNSPPFSPTGLKVKQIKEGGTLVEWKAATDPDGTVVKYNINKLNIYKKEFLGDSKETNFNATEKIPAYKILVSAVDDKGAESPPLYAIMLPLSFTPGVVFPLEKFGFMYNVGFGGMLSFSARNLFFYNFEGGVSLGFYYLPGKDLQDEKNKKYNDFMLVPAYLYAGYNIGIAAGFCLKPVISIGGAYLDVKYFDRNKTISEGRDIHMQIFEISFKAGITAEYRFENSLSVTLGCEYGAIIEKSGLLHFIVLNAGISYSF